ncbi:glycosyltransferase family 4 protein [Marinobacter daepoensis]|uniref:glycosyltransferase family 4 protein n=1 Tax=Marinobacter daepoensis TaxID=262077 RepID=UPI001C957506|nr:glycosyltransferase family 4 protein [Marinobacter daepoensis]MBY6033634.1 glycosyltransferase family 4 protein [Marinobacter daepoensis]
MAGGTRSYEMARRMVAAGHEVQMITSYREGDGGRKGWYMTEEEGIQVHWYPVPYSNHMGFLQRLKAFFSFAFAARRKALEFEADVVFATSTPLTIALPAVPAARKKKVPMVFEVRDLWPEMPIAVGALNNPLLRLAARKLEHWAYHSADAVVALSPGMREGVVSTGYPAKNVAVIPNSSDNSEFVRNDQEGADFRAQRDWLGNRPLLVYAGTFGPVNGVGYMVSVAEELRRINSDVRILLVGDGAEKAELIRSAEQVGVLGENLFVEDALPKRKIPALLSAADMASALFIDLPEMQSNSANKFFDALASGTPIMINYGGWMHEMVRSSNCGIAMWECSPAEVAAELDRKLNDKKWLDHAGRSARQLAETFFDRDVLADQLIQVLEAAVDRQGDRAAEIAPGEYRFS